MSNPMVNLALVTPAEQEWAARIAATGTPQQKAEIASSHGAFVAQQEEDKPLYEEIAEKEKEAEEQRKEEQEEAAEKVAEENEVRQEQYEAQVEAQQAAAEGE